MIRSFLLIFKKPQVDHSNGTRLMKVLKRHYDDLEYIVDRGVGYNLYLGTAQADARKLELTLKQLDTVQVIELGADHAGLPKDVRIFLENIRIFNEQRRAQGLKRVPEPIDKQEGHIPQPMPPRTIERTKEMSDRVSGGGILVRLVDHRRLNPR